MKYIQNTRTVLRLLNQYVPDSDSSAGNVILYIQDVTYSRMQVFSYQFMQDNFTSLCNRWQSI